MRCNPKYFLPLLLLALLWAIGSWKMYTCGVKGFCPKAQIAMYDNAPKPTPVAAPVVDTNPIVAVSPGETAVVRGDDRVTIYFPFNSDEEITNTEITDYLSELATRLRSGGVTARIVGHTDSVGDAGINATLGQQRADAVSDILIGRYNVDASSIVTASEGEVNPVADNETSEGRALNRRVEIFTN